MRDERFAASGWSPRSTPPPDDSYNVVSDTALACQEWLHMYKVLSHQCPLPAHSVRVVLCTIGNSACRGCSQGIPPAEGDVSAI